MVHNEVLRLLGQLIECLLAHVEPGFQRQHVPEQGAAVLADIAEGQIAAIHAQNDQGPGDAEDGGGLAEELASGGEGVERVVVLRRAAEELPLRDDRLLDWGAFLALGQDAVVKFTSPGKGQVPPFAAASSSWL